MKPEDLLDPGNFPGDLKWVPEHYRLHPQDPVYLLIAWHWKRIKAAEDTLGAALIELKSSLNLRVEALKESTSSVVAVGDALARVREDLEKKPEALSRQLEKELAQPLGAALARLQELERKLTSVGATFAAARRRLLLATLLTGVAIGVLGSAILIFP